MTPIPPQQKRSISYPRVFIFIILISLVISFLFKVNFIFTLIFFFGLLFIAWFISPAITSHNRNPYLPYATERFDLGGTYNIRHHNLERPFVENDQDAEEKLNNYYSHVDLENRADNFIQCSNCGTKIDYKDDYCQSCGQKI